VNSIPRISPRWSRLAFAAPFLAFLLQPSLLPAQAPPIPERLPPDTVFYIHWHGKASFTAASAKNHVLQLYKDPDLAPLWTGLLNAMSNKKPIRGLPPQMVLAAASSLLENPAVVGFVANPTLPQLTPSSRSLPSPGEFFLVYDETGKTDLIRMLTSAEDASAGAPSTVTSYDFDGTSVEVRTWNGKPTFSAHTGGYFLVSSLKRTIEDLITRFRTSARPAASLGQLPEYQTIIKYIGSDTSLDFYGQLPNFSKWIPPGEKYKPLARFVQDLHLEKVRAAGEGVSFSGETTRLRGAVLGDTSPGGLFDIIGPSSPKFLTQPVIGAAQSFSISREDFRAMYQVLRSAIFEALPPEQARSAAQIEGIAEVYLGMPLQDALGLFTGEFTSATTYSDDGTQQALYAATIEKPNDVLRVLRAALGKVITAENSSGDTTYLDLLLPISKSPTQHKTFYYVAVTPKMLLAAPRKAMLREAIARLNSQSSAALAGGIFADPEYIQLRSLLPAGLSDLNGYELDRIPWNKIAENFEDRSEHSQSQIQVNSQTLDLVSLLKQVNFDVISRHLHRSAGGGWKDPTGVYFDSYLQ
jgi:hypothetical protein